MQQLLVALIVTGCSLYALWVLLPAAARRGLARQLLRLRWPAAVQRRLTAAAAVPSGCGCNGCDRGTQAPKAPEGAQPIRIHRPSRH